MQLLVFLNLILNLIFLNLILVLRLFYFYQINDALVFIWYFIVSFGTRWRPRFCRGSCRVGYIVKLARAKLPAKAAGKLIRR